MTGTSHAPAPARITTRIPDEFLDLIDCPRVAALTTIMPDGHPQTTAVWCNFDGTHVLINVMRGFQKEKNMRRNARVTLLCYDPREPLRSLEVRFVLGDGDARAVPHSANTRGSTGRAACNMKSLSHTATCSRVRCQAC
jgi:nitroimidazol reductase NimA-like FMN-containing flavoprotein (pyridoxamine 5'-phosphate oxidase superfamily)